MKKYIRTLEIPILLLVIALFTLDKGYMGLTIFLSLVSIARLEVNIMTDDFIYKK